MDKEEKVEYILEQVRLCLDKGDFVRGTIVSKKLTAKTFKDDILQDLKVRYYELLNRIGNDKDDYLEMANNHYAIFQTPSVQEKTERWTGVPSLSLCYLFLSRALSLCGTYRGCACMRVGVCGCINAACNASTKIAGILKKGMLAAALKDIAVFLVLAPHDNHQKDFLERILTEKKLDQLKAYKMLLTLFKTVELIQWSSFQELYKTELLAHSAFGGDKQEPRWKDLVTLVCACERWRCVHVYHSRPYIAYTT